MTDTATRDGDPAGLAGKRVLVTGGTRGIGAAAARRFAQSGADVVVAARPPVATPGGAAELAERTLEILGGIDVVVDNAGDTFSVLGGVLVGDEEWLRGLEANLLSAVRLDRALLPTMIEQRSGAIIHVTSMLARSPEPASPVYSAAKAALTSYSKALAKGVGRHGIRVNAVVPGLIDTPLMAGIMEELADQMGTDPQAVRRQTLDRYDAPLARMGQPDEVAELIVFLASERAGYLTGGQYVVDGGLIPTL